MPPRNSIAKKLVLASLAFHRMKPWELIAGDSAIALVLPTEPQPVFAFIMGHAGEEFGLTLWRGENALQQIDGLNSQGMTHEVASMVDSISFSVQPLHEIPSQCRSLLQEAQFAARREDLAPMFIVKRPGKMARDPNATERKTLLCAINAVRKVFGANGPPELPDELPSMLTLVATGNSANPDVTFEVRTYKLSNKKMPNALPMAPFGLEDLPRLDVTWAVGWPELPASIKGEDRSISALIVGEEESGRVVAVKPCVGRDTEVASQKLFETLEGKNALEVPGLPRRLLISHLDLFNAVAPTLQAFGVDCEYIASHPFIDEICDKLFEDITEREDDEASPASCAPRSGKTLDVDDIDGWKEAEQEVLRQGLKEVLHDDLMNDASLKQYFGDHDEVHERLGSGEKSIIIPGFTEWLLFEYRSAPNASTAGERMMKKKSLSAAAKALIQSRLTQLPSIYRFDSTKPGDHLVLVDLLSGAKRTVHDRLMSKSAEPNHGVVLRLFQAGSFWFASLYGPSLTPHQLSPAVAYLESIGLELTPEGIKNQPHLFGRLWDWASQQAAINSKLPILKNTDGHDLIWQKAVFDLDNPDKVWRALGRRKDLEAEPDTDEYVWFRKATERKNLLGGPIHLGRLQILGSELLLDVNSAERLQKAKQWLEKIPGVTFRSAVARTFEQLRDEEGPLDDRLPDPDPGELDPEALAGIQEMFRKQCLNWVDERVPALGNRTPRQVAKTEQGRAEVKRMILAWPDPSGNVPGLRVPRLEILKELGLES